MRVKNFLEYFLTPFNNSLATCCRTCVYASYESLFIDLGLLEEEVEKILESNYNVYLENRKIKQFANRDLLNHWGLNP
jgi:hypothetical protein